MGDIDEETTFSVRDEVIVEEIDGELVVLDLDGDVCFSLNEVGRIVWEAADAGESFAGIVDAVVDAYDVDRQRAAEDARQFLDRSRDHQLIEPE